MSRDPPDVTKTWESLNKNWIFEGWIKYLAEVRFIHSLSHHCYKVIADTKMLLLKRKRNY
jgi:hypothetical protein